MDPCFDPQDPFLERHARRRFRHAEDAADAAQEIRLRAIELGPDAISNPKAWSVSVALHLAIDTARRRRIARAHVEAASEDLLHAGVVPSAESTATAKLHLREALELLSCSLGPVDAGILLLREYFELEYSAIAAMAGHSEAACRQRHHRALVRLLTRRARGDDRHHGTRRDRRAPDPEESACVYAACCRAIALHDAQALTALFGTPIEAAMQPVRPLPGAAQEHPGTRVRTGFAGTSPVLLVELDGCLLCVLPLGPRPDRQADRACTDRR